MALLVRRFTLGPLDNNTYLLVDKDTLQAALIDPTFSSGVAGTTAQQEGWNLTQIWLTHAHFDHIAGVADAARSMVPPLPIGLHPLDLPLWQTGGGGELFGMKLDTDLKPTIHFQDGQELQLGDSRLRVLHTPGHTPGHVVFYAQADGIVFSGDLIFRGSVGRTDLPGGSWEQERTSIQRKILTLPPETRLLSGHGPETTIARELLENPYLS